MIKYDSYIDSGIEWIGLIPKHWKVSKIKNVTKIFGRIGYRGYTTEDIVDEGEGVITISPSNIQKDIFNIDSVTYLSFDKYYESPEIMIFPNDIILVKTGSTIGKTSIIPDNVPEMTINPQLVVLKDILLHNKYLYYQTTCNFIKESFEIEQTGSTTPTISQEKIYNFPVLTPTDIEQTQIVQYLDTKTNLIDTLIQKTHEKINLLREKRTSLINHTVTKGLNPNVEMKDSGVNWIGKIPVHWKLTKLKYGVRLIIDKGIPEQGNIKISPENVESNTGKCFNLFSDYTGEGMKFISGDVLLNKLRLYLKKIILTEYDGYSMGEMIVLRSNNNLNNKYLYYLLFHQGLIDLLDSQSTGVKLPRVSPEIILNSEIVYPPYIEQLQIVDFLVDQSQKIDTIIQKEEKRIELLKEYRQSLISDVITGKIKVTDYE
jgi:type I restriction enzyme S subunit